MVFWLFKRKEKKNELLDELNAIKERVVRNENDLKSLESAVSGEVKKLYEYISEIHNDIDSLNEVLQEIKAKAGGVSSDRIVVLERKMADMEQNLGYLRIVGKVALKNHERVSNLEMKVEELMNALDSLVAELRERDSKFESIQREEKKDHSDHVKIINKSISIEPERGVSSHKLGKKVIKRVSTRDYLAELNRLRNELLQLKSTR